MNRWVVGQQLLYYFMFKIPFIFCIVTVLFAQNTQKDAYEQQLVNIITKLQNSLAQQQNIANKSIIFVENTNFPQNVKQEMLNQGFQEIRSSVSSGIGASAIPYNLKTWNCSSITAEEYSKLIEANNQLMAHDASLGNSVKRIENNNQCSKVEEIEDLYGLIHQEIGLFSNQIKQFCPNISATTSPATTTNNNGSTTSSTNGSKPSNTNGSSISNTNGSTTTGSNAQTSTSTNASTPTNNNNGSTPTNNNNGSMPSYINNGSTPSYINNGSTPSYINNGSTPSNTNGSTPTNINNGSTPSKPNGLAPPTTNGLTPANNNESTNNNPSKPSGLTPPITNGSTNTNPNGSTSTSPIGLTNTNQNGSTNNNLNGSTNISPNGSTNNYPNGSTSTSPIGSTNTNPNGSTAPNNPNTNVNPTTSNLNPLNPTIPITSVPVFVNNLAATDNWIYGGIQTPTYYSQVNQHIKKGAKTCPLNTPYVDLYDKCMSCPYLYDLSKRLCASCPSGSNYNSQTHECDTANGQNVLKNSNSAVGNFVGTAPNTLSNLLTCPLETPYFNGISCISCSAPNYFDFTNQVCLTCTTGMAFDTQSKICKPIYNSVSPTYKIYSSNFQSGIKNYVGDIPSFDNRYDYCPFTEPYFNGMNCISCTSPLFFNFTSNLCQSCETYYKLDENTKTCVIDESKIYFSNNVNDVQNYIGTPPVLAPQNGKLIQSCPQNAPFSNGKVCFICQYPKFYNFQTGNCQICANDFIFNLTTKVCNAKVSSNGAIKNSNVEKATNFMNQMPQYNSSLASCDTLAPYFNGQVCISCNLPSFFNFQTFRCENCPSLLVFDTENRQCQFANQKFVTNLDNPNVYYNGDFQNVITETNQKLSSNQNIQTCPQSSPFYDATTNRCINCPQNTPIFNVKYNLCMGCASDSHFDQQSRICIYNQNVKFSLERALMNTI